MSYNAMEQYFEALNRERTNEAWKQVASEIGRVEPEEAQVQVIQPQTEPQNADGYDYLQNADKIEERIDHELSFEKGIRKLSQQIGSITD